MFMAGNYPQDLTAAGRWNAAHFSDDQIFPGNRDLRALKTSCNFSEVRLSDVNGSELERGANCLEEEETPGEIHHFNKVKSRPYLIVQNAAAYLRGGKSGRRLHYIFIWGSANFESLIFIWIFLPLFGLGPSRYFWDYASPVFRVSASEKRPSPPPPFLNDFSKTIWKQHCFQRTVNWIIRGSKNILRQSSGH